MLPLLTEVMAPAPLARLIIELAVKALCSGYFSFEVVAVGAVYQLFSFDIIRSVSVL